MLPGAATRIAAPTWKALERFPPYFPARGIHQKQRIIKEGSGKVGGRQQRVGPVTSGYESRSVAGSSPAVFAPGKKGDEVMKAAKKFALAVKPIPEGYHTITPYLTVRGADRAIESIAGRSARRSSSG